MTNDRQKLFDELGLPKVPLFSDDVESPEPVDVEKIRAFNAGQLDPVEDEWVAFLISHYRDWFEADLDDRQGDGGTANR